ncbi:cytochrome c biogenesis protein ResB [Pseudonocardia benzenivorans]
MVRGHLPAADDLARRLPAAAQPRLPADAAGGSRRHPAQPRPAAAPRRGDRRRGHRRGPRPRPDPARRQPAHGLAHRRTRRDRRRAHRLGREGHLREAGNLVFHLSLVGLLVGIALGKLFGYEGQVIVLTGGNQFCNSSILGYDSFRAGLRVDGTELAPFCVQVNDFTADYLPNGQPDTYRAQIGYQTAEDVEAGDTSNWKPYELQVNHPLRLDGARVYLLGHGYAPQFTVTWPDGQQRTGVIQWRPVDQTTFLSEGATKFERPGVTDPAQRQDSGLAVTGLFAPTSSGGDVVTSIYPDLRNPEVAIDVMRGDLGLDDGRGQSIFTVDQSKVDSGALKQVARANLTPASRSRSTTARRSGSTVSPPGCRCRSATTPARSRC